jgi:hypothetical protein
MSSALPDVLLRIHAASKAQLLSAPERTRVKKLALDGGVGLEAAQALLEAREKSATVARPGRASVGAKSAAPASSPAAGESKAPPATAAAPLVVPSERKEVVEMAPPQPLPSPHALTSGVSSVRKIRCRPRRWALARSLAHARTRPGSRKNMLSIGGAAASAPARRAMPACRWPWSRDPRGAPASTCRRSTWPATRSSVSTWCAARRSARARARLQPRARPRSGRLLRPDAFWALQRPPPGQGAARTKCPPSRPRRRRSATCWSRECTPVTRFWPTRAQRS